MPGRRLGEAYVEVGAETGGFGTGLAARLRAELRSANNAAKAAGKRIGRRISDGIGDELVRQSPMIRARLNLALRGIRVTVPIRVDVDTDIDRASLDRLLARLRGQLSSEMFGGLFSAGKGLQGIFGSLASSPQMLATVVTAAALGATALAGAFNAAGREALNLVKLSAYLPAGISAIIATALTLKVAFSGVGDALSAVFERDPEKLDAALKKLTPSARKFVLEFQGLLPILDKIKANTQESLFAPLLGIVTRIGQALGPTILVGMGTLASNLAAMLRPIGDLFASEKTQAFLTNLFQSTANIIGVLGQPIANLISAFISLANAALPSLEAAGGGLAAMIEKLAAWLETAVANGSFQEWLDSAARTFGDIKYVVGELALLFGVLFDDANLEGRSFLQVIGDMIRDFRKFAESPDGKMALDGIATAAKIAGAILMGMLMTIWTIVAAIGSFIAAVERAINWLGVLDAKRSNVLNKGFGIFGGIAGFVAAHAEGGIVNRPVLSTLAEEGPEVVIPLTRPDRARRLAEDSGLTKMLGGSGNTTQIFYLGTEQVDARIARISGEQVDASVSDAAYGTRAA